MDFMLLVRRGSFQDRAMASFQSQDTGQLARLDCPAECYHGIHYIDVFRHLNQMATRKEFTKFHIPVGV